MYAYFSWFYNQLLILITIKRWITWYWIRVGKRGVLLMFCDFWKSTHVLIRSIHCTSRLTRIRTPTPYSINKTNIQYLGPDFTRAKMCKMNSHFATIPSISALVENELYAKVWMYPTLSESLHKTLTTLRTNCKMSVLFEMAP